MSNQYPSQGGPDRPYGQQPNQPPYQPQFQQQPRFQSQPYQPQFQPQYGGPQFQPQPPQKKGMKTWQVALLVVGAVFVGLIIIGAVGAVVGAGNEPAAPSSVASTAHASPSATATHSAKSTPKAMKATPKPKPKPTKTAPALTGQQQNAVQAAQSYLSDGQGFSKAGLISQLSSQYGDGYSLHDATVAVDSLTVNWDQQAVISAKGYVSSQSFSCSDLIDQLDSAYGEQFTVAQATYGAHQTSACS